MQNQNSMDQFPCPFCNTLNKASAKFSRACGKNIAEAMNINTVSQANMFCPQCGVANNADAAFCKECGYRFAQASVPRVQEAVMQGVNTIICPKCGVSNKEDAAFCKECGQKLAPNIISSPAVVQEEQTKVAEPVTSIAVDVNKETLSRTGIWCPNCGVPDEAEAAFCKGCGQKLAVEQTVVQPQIQDEKQQISITAAQSTEIEKTQVPQKEVELHQPITYAYNPLDRVYLKGEVYCERTGPASYITTGGTTYLFTFEDKLLMERTGKRSYFISDKEADSIVDYKFMFYKERKKGNGNG